MTQDAKFELENMQAILNIAISQPKTAVSLSSQPKSAATEPNCLSSDKKEKVSDDLFFSQFDEIFMVDFNEESSSTYDNFGCDMQNPENQCSNNSKLPLEMQTMID